MTLFIGRNNKARPAQVLITYTQATVNKGPDSCSKILPPEINRPPAIEYQTVYFFLDVAILFTDEPMREPARAKSARIFEVRLYLHRPKLPMFFTKRSIIGWVRLI